MSGSGFTKEILKLTKEKRRELQFQKLKAWNRGRITGRECIESIVDLDNVLVLYMEDINKIRRQSGQADTDTEDTTD